MAQKKNTDRQAIGEGETPDPADYTEPLTPAEHAEVTERLRGDVGDHDPGNPVSNTTGEYLPEVANETAPDDTEA